IVLPRHGDMSLDTAEADQLAGYIEANAKHFIKVTEPQEFDLLMLIQAGYPTHIGCAIDSEYMIHLQTGCNVAIEPYSVSGGVGASTAFIVMKRCSMADKVKPTFRCDVFPIAL